MNKSSLKTRRSLRKSLLLYRLETGFSMLEAVVVVGVLLALAVGGFFAYGPITENAKRAKVKSAASEVHTGVVVASIDGDSTTQPQDVIDNWNNSTDKIRVEIIPPTDGETSANGDFCVSATNVESPYITSRTGSCVPGAEVPILDTDSDGIPNDTDPDIDGDGISNGSDPDVDGDGTPNGEDTTPNGGISAPDTDTPPVEEVAPGEWSSRLADTNYILDPRFETASTAGWDVTPVESYPSVVDSITVDPTKGIGGGPALKATTQTKTGWSTVNSIAYRLPVPGVYSKFSMNVAADYKASDDRAINAVIVNYRNGALVNPRYSAYGWADVGDTTGWKQMNLSVPPTIPGDVLYLIVRSGGNGPRADHLPSAFYIDNMMMNRASSNNYFDGDSAAAGEFSYEWSGIPNESVSQKNTSRQVSLPAVVTLGQDFQVWGRGYPPNIEVNVYESGSYEYYSDVYVMTDSSGNFRATLNIPPSTHPDGGMDPGQGFIYTSAGSGTSIELEVTLQ